MKDEQPDHKTCHAAVNIEHNTNEEILKKMSKTEELLLKLNERIDKLEQQKEPPDSDRQYYQGYSYGRGYRGDIEAIVEEDGIVAEVEVTMRSH
ncbi:hypothetical protein DPMN_043843 [Dreissena polymorpha]|uniref:Uncharacterized protein n=1 Tax=Dreissena polymorpha TaxID=45954 RepID=A0A9D4HVZ6_DREPO|nr:hypothetical protein DPMN_043843 [Dreissena polymorpha]